MLAKCLARVCIASGLVLGLAACSSTLREEPTALEFDDSAVEATQEYVIGPRDQLHISVWRQPDLSVNVEVRLDGKISVPLIDDVQAAGLTALELKQVVSERLEEFISAPHVTVVVASIQSKMVYMMGEVAREGALPYQPEMRVVDAISLAGGFNPFSGKDRVKVIRRHRDGGAQEFEFNFNAYVRGTNLDQNILLMPGDRIIVPQERPFLFR